MPTQTWNLDPSHSSATFSIRHMMISKVRGEFGALEGQVSFDPENPETATITCAARTSSTSRRSRRSPSSRARSRAPATTWS